MTNEELVLEIQSGRTELLSELWEQTEKLIKIPIDKFIRRQTLPNYIDDLLQCGYFALLRAVKAYNPNKGFKFNTYLEYSVKNAIADTIERKKQLKEFSYLISGLVSS